MTVSASSLYFKMSWRKGNSPGWAAFERKQRQEQGLLPEVDEEPYPSILSNHTSLKPCENLMKNNLSLKSFSSVLLPSSDFPTLTESKECQKLIQVGNFSDKPCTNSVEETKDVMVLSNKELYCKADCTMIEDNMAAVDNNVNMASTSLKTIAFARSFEKMKGTHTEFLDSSSDDFTRNKRIHQCVSSAKTAGMGDPSSSLEDYQKGTNKQFPYEDTSCEKRLSDDTVDMELLLGYLNSIPVEPEWEEDDVYLSHRKDAKRVMRSASQHSRAASNAFQRGDHVAAQQHALKAREDWLAAKRLNAKAAKEILSIRNSKYDVWKLDLHGLHAAEAVEALQEHLLKVEASVPSRSSVSPNRVRTNNSIKYSQSLQSFSCLEVENLEKQQRSSRLRPTSLQVITGVGNHSRGQAALPTVVRSFLNENGYHFDEARPGVISVQPKFRHR